MANNRKISILGKYRKITENCKSGINVPGNGITDILPLSMFDGKMLTTQLQGILP